jgi:two-component system NtrC family sensor kinase
MTRHERQLRHLPPVAAAIVVLITALVLIGWALHVEVLKSLLHPQRIAMNPVTALSLMLCGIALWLLRDEPSPPRRRRAAHVCGAVVAGVALSRLIGYWLQWPLGIDQMLFPSRLAGNVMAPNTAATLLLVGLALIVLDGDTRRGFHPAQILVFAAGGVALFSLAGYLYSSMSLTGMSGYIPMALNTAIAIAVLCLGLLCARPAREPVRTIVSDTLGGTMARRLVPAALVAPLLIGWLILRGARIGFYDPESGLALFVLANVIVFNLVVWWSARVVHASDTHRRLSQDVLRQNEERHRAVMEQAAEGIYLVDLDTKQIIDSNAALDRLLDYEPGEARRRTVYDLVDDTPEGVDARLQRLANATTPMHAERQYRRKDGSHIDVEVSATVIAYGGRRVACTVVHDITARKQAEHELQEKNRLLEEAVASERDAIGKLRESEERHRVVVQQAAEGITLVDAESLRILEVNEAFARLVGYAPDELLDRPISDFIVDSVAGVASRAHQTLDSGTATAVQRQYRRKDGSVVDVEKSATVLTLNGRRVLCTVLHDVTDRNRAERALHEKHRQLEETLEQLKQAQSFMVQSEKLAGLGQMVAGVAHEINNPLAFVSNNVAVLQRDTKSLCAMIAMYQKADALLAERDGELLAAIRELSDRMDLSYTTANLDEMLVRSRDGLRRIQQIVKDLRDFARLDESDLHEVDLNAGIASTVNIIQGHAKKKRVTIEKRLADLPHVMCHPAKVNQVIMNLVGNAIDACPEGGRVTVGSAANGNHVTIEVSDTGPGVPDTIRERIFDPFFTTKPPGEGTGLGLSISYGIVKDHGGSIELTDAPGGGARFVVTLPTDCR